MEAESSTLTLSTLLPLMTIIVAFLCGSRCVLRRVFCVAMTHMSHAFRGTSSEVLHSFTVISMFFERPARPAVPSVKQQVGAFVSAKPHPSLEAQSCKHPSLPAGNIEAAVVDQVREISPNTKLRDEIILQAMLATQQGQSEFESHHVQLTRRLTRARPQLRGYRTDRNARQCNLFCQRARRRWSSICELNLNLD
jgi:hypothetical protein